MVIRGTGIITQHSDNTITVKYIPEDCEVVEISKEVLEDFIRAVNIINEIRRALECDCDKTE